MRHHAAFIQGHNIKEYIFLMQDIMHSLMKAYRTKSLMTTKLDIEKAYDHINWHYMLLVLSYFVFHP